MTLSGTRLKTALAADILTQLESEYPISGSLQPAEQTYLETAQQNLANAIANAVGPDVVSEIVTNAVVPSTVAVTSVSAVTPGIGTSGPGAGTATGTVT